MLGIGITLGALVVLIIATIVIYNKLVKYKNLMQEAWSAIDVFLKKRHELVPNLVETVKGYATHEKTTLEEITRYRMKAMLSRHNSEDQVASENRLGEALTNLLVTVENYPDLKANTNFLRLQQQLTDLEHDLEASRRYYNGTVRINNIYVEKFPSNIIAGIFNFRKGMFFAADSSEKGVPQVSF
ncbi:MAG: LemA family protein [Dysgonamonadaceae bacterium]|jgi:LemA protein|nr:LemA family protein [Dysgonamonadaceae bacterium]